MATVTLDESVGTELLRYARLVAGRGYIHNSLGNIAIRVPHPDFEHGVAYTKPAEVSLEEMTLDNVVITDIPTPTLLHGTVPTSVGHNLNREILRLRPDVGAVIHAHHDETTLGRTVSEAYHRLNTLSSEVRRNVMAVQLAAAAGREIHAIAPDSVAWMYRHAESVIYPSRDATRRPAGGDRQA